MLNYIDLIGNIWVVVMEFHTHWLHTNQKTINKRQLTHLDQASNYENIKDHHHWPRFEWNGYTHKGPIMRGGFSCHEAIMLIVDRGGSKINSPPPPLPLDKMAAALAHDIFKCMFLNENDRIPIQISLKFIPRSPIDNKPAVAQVMAWRRIGDKPLSEPMLTWFTYANMRH